MKNTTRIIAILLMTCTLFAFSSCQDNKDSTQSMRIMLQSQKGSKSITPSGVDLSCVKYTITGTGPNGATFNMNTAKTAIVLEGLKTGSWTLQAKGLNSQNTALVEGSTTCNLSSSNNSATIVLNTLLGKGSINVDFTWDKTRIQNPSITIDITEQQGEKRKVSYTPTSLDVANGKASYVKNDVAAGSYVMQAKLLDSNVCVAGCVEAIRIVNNAIAKGTIAFDLDKFPDNPGSMTIINQAGVPVACSITGIESQIAANTPVSPTFTASNASLRDLSISWFLDGIEIGKGTTTTFTPSTGTHRLDVVANTPLLGSSGSTSYPFEAIVLGKTGEPVLTSTIENGAVKLGGDNQIAFLPDGKILIASDANDTVQICSFVRNTLIVEKTYSAGSSSFSTSNITDINILPSSNLVIFTYNKPSGVARLKYNSNTSTLSQEMICEANIWYRELEKEKATDLTGFFLDAKRDLFGVIGKSPAGDYSHILWRSKTSKIQNEYVYDQRMLKYAVPGTIDLVAVSPHDDTGILINRTSGKIGTHSLDTGGYYSVMTKLPELETYAKNSSAIIFIDFQHAVIANGDKLHLIEGESNHWALKHSHTQTGGSGASVMIPSADGAFLYVCNETTQNLITYAVSSQYTFTPISSIDLPFAPGEAKISSSGEYMIVTSRNGTSLCIFRIKKA